jgi:hypothetical protein
MRTTKNRLGDPSAICALDFKGEFRRIRFCPVSGTINIDRSIFDISSVSPSSADRPKIPSEGALPLLLRRLEAAAREAGSAFLDSERDSQIGNQSAVFRDDGGRWQWHELTARICVIV